MDRDAIARAQRVRQALEALEVERDRMAMLEGQIEELVTELIGARIDEEAFAMMAPEEVETVRGILDPRPEYEVDEEWLPAEDDELVVVEEAVDEPHDPEAEAEAEIARLEAEVAVSLQRQQAFERYLEALDGSGTSASAGSRDRPSRSRDPATGT